MKIHYEIPNDLHKALKVRAAEDGITLKDLIIQFLWAGLGGKRHIRDLTPNHWEIDQ